MKVFILKLLFGIFLPGVICYAIFIGIQNKIDNRLVQTKISNEYYDWENIIRGKIQADLLIQGSSRAWTTFNPLEIDLKFKLNSYNLGMAAYHFDGQFARWEVYRKHNRLPKYIIQCIDYNLLDQTTQLFDIQQFIPYVSEKSIYNFLLESDQINFFELNIPLYKFKWIKPNSTCLSSSLSLIIDSIGTINKPYSDKYKGFKAQDLYWGSLNMNIANIGNVKKYEAVNFFDSKSLGFFDSFISYCKLNNIKLIFVYPPEYYKIKEYIKSYNSRIDFFKKIANRNQIPFMDYSSSTLANDTSFFYDFRHLNRKGADTFNKIFLNDLSLLIK